MSSSAPADVATKADIGRLEARFDAMDARLQAQADATHELALTMERELRHVYREIAAHTRSIVFACVGSIMTAGGLAFAFGTAT